MASLDPWNDFYTVRHNIKQNTVDRLKHIITGFNEQAGTNISKTGKKQELIDKINQHLDTWKTSLALDRWNKAKAVLYQVQNSGIYSPAKMPSEGTGQYAAYPLPSSSKLNANPTIPTAGRFDPSVPRKPIASSSVGPSGQRPAIRFKSSPFLRVEQAVSNLVECPESSSAMDRRQQAVVFSLTQDQITKLTSTNPKWQLRLYCTSNSHYTPGAFNSNQPCPIEFPPTCEVRINNIQLTANLKGLKKKPGTAPPADLGKAVRMTGQNRVEMVYVNSQQGTPSKKYYLVVQLAEVTSVDQLVDRVKKGKYKSKDEIITTMKACAGSDDDDIVMGSQKMSLRDALTFVRVKDPCRSSICPHPQCFDAATWFTVMEQTTTWLCPVCDRILNPDDLIIDGYFEDILKQTPESVDEVMVEADGDWHSLDNKYASAGWRSTHPYVPAAAPPKPVPRSPPKASTNGKARANEILVLDDSDDDSDDAQVKRELSPRVPLSADSSFATMPPQSQHSDSGVIDLTLDSDDEEPPRRNQPVAVVRTEKRKASPDVMPSPTEQVWKKSRVDPPRANGHANGSTSYAGSSANAFNSTPAYSSFQARPTTSRTPSASGAAYQTTTYAAPSQAYGYTTAAANTSNFTSGRAHGAGSGRRT